MSDTPQVLLAHHLKALRLPTFLREYDKLARQCAAEGVDHPRYLLRLAELELIDRERRTIERRIKSLRSSGGLARYRENLMLDEPPLMIRTLIGPVIRQICGKTRSSPTGSGPHNTPI
jgi:hypothetical protein